MWCSVFVVLSLYLPFLLITWDSSVYLTAHKSEWLHVKKNFFDIFSHCIELPTVGRGLINVQEVLWWRTVWNDTGAMSKERTKPFRATTSLTSCITNVFWPKCYGLSVSTLFCPRHCMCDLILCLILAVGKERHVNLRERYVSKTTPLDVSLLLLETNF